MSRTNSSLGSGPRSLDINQLANCSHHSHLQLGHPIPVLSVTYASPEMLKPPNSTNYIPYSPTTNESLDFFFTYFTCSCSALFEVDNTATGRLPIVSRYPEETRRPLPLGARAVPRPVLTLESRAGHRDRSDDGTCHNPSRGPVTDVPALRER